MMKKRGYTILPNEKSIIETPVTESIFNFDQMYRKQASDRKIAIEALLGGMYTHSKNPKDTVRIIYIETDANEIQIKKEKTDEIVNAISANISNTHIILVSRVKFRPQNYTSLLDLKSYWIEHFVYEELLYDPTDHKVLQPRIELQSFEKSNQFLKNLGKDAVNLQKICIDDPVIKFLGGRIGQIIAITRKLKFKAAVTVGGSVRLIIGHSIFEEKDKIKKQ
jgi:DNA-directed RNA polymerase subunit H (RpoH/RPB5)